jgi:hypothetical protein
MSISKRTIHVLNFLVLLRTKGKVEAIVPIEKVYLTYSMQFSLDIALICATR